MEHTEKQFIYEDKELDDIIKNLPENVEKEVFLKGMKLMREKYEDSINSLYKSLYKEFDASIINSEREDVFNDILDIFEAKYKYCNE